MDIVPIVNYTWDRSFLTVRNNKKAILEQGWFSDNRALLDHPDVLRTKPTINNAASTTNDINVRNKRSAAQTIDGGKSVLNVNNGTIPILLEDVVYKQKTNQKR
jgi:hypothetical protein